MSSLICTNTKFLTQFLICTTLLNIIYLTTNFRQIKKLSSASSHKRIFKFNIDVTQPFWKFRPRVICNCDNNRYSDEKSKIFRISSPLLTNSTCSPEATAAGLNQKVISFSHFDGNRVRNYVQDIEENLKLIRNFYSGWLMRVYSNKPLTKAMCSLICQNQQDFFYCPIQFVDMFDVGLVSKEFPMQWRFLVLGDPTVERFLIRDLDSRITEREVYAVREWEKSGKIFHGMRDNPAHNTEIMGGTWGGNNKLLGDYARLMQRYIVLNQENRNNVGVDQTSLTIYVYYFNKSKSILTHDSYLCNVYHDSVPFPTERTNLREFVGQPKEDTSEDFQVKQCPEECRPSFGRNWIYC